MRLQLDGDDRFELVAREGGWDLIVDDKIVHYCREPADAVRYMSETLMEEADVRGLGPVVDTLGRIEKSIRDASEIVTTRRAAEMLAPALSGAAVPVAGSRKELTRRVSLAIARCTEPELRLRVDRKQVVAKARAALEPFFQNWGLPDAD